MSVPWFGRPPTKRQKDVLRFVKAYCREHRFSPTLREMCEGLGIKSPNGVACHLDSLRRRGLVAWEPGKKRTLVVVG